MGRQTKDLSIQDQFKLANSRHLSALDSVLSKYQGIQDEDEEEEALLPDQIGRDVLSDDEEHDEGDDDFDIDFRMMFTKFPKNDQPKKFTSTPRNDPLLRTLREQPKLADSSPIVSGLKKASFPERPRPPLDASPIVTKTRPRALELGSQAQEMAVDSSPIVISSKKTAAAAARDEPATKPPSQLHSSIMKLFNFRRTSQELSIRSQNLDDISRNDKVVPVSKHKTDGAENRPPKPAARLRADPSPPRRKPSPRPSLTLVSAVNTPYGSPQRDRRAAPDEQPEIMIVDEPPAAQEEESKARKVIREWTARHGGRCVVQPELLQLLAKNSRYTSTKSDEQRAEEARRAKEAASRIKYKPSKRLGDPLLDLIRKGAKLGVPRNSSQPSSSP